MPRRRRGVRRIADVQRPLEDGRRPRPALLGLTALALLLLVAGWIRYDPLERGGVGTCPEGSEEVPIGEGVEADEVVCSISNQEATTVTFSTAAYNSGLLPVRIAEVTLRGDVGGLFDVEEVLTWPDNNHRGAVDAELVAFEPFRLAPGDERLVWVAMALPSCETAPRDRVLLFHDVPVRASVLGLPRDSQVPLDPPVRLIIERC